MVITDLLGKLKQINNSNVVEVFVPSQNRIVKFKQLSVKQQKELIKTSLDGALAGVTLGSALNMIVSENAIDCDIFNIFDRAPIILSLRQQSFGSTYTEGDAIVDLNEITQKQYVINVPFASTINLEDEISIDLEVPSLQCDTKINEVVAAQLKKTQDVNLGDAVGSLYLYEIVKFIKKVKVASDVAVFDDYVVADQLKIIENLPAKIINQVVDFIQQFRTLETDYLTIEQTVVSLDARMFTR